MNKWNWDLERRKRKNRRKEMKKKRNKRKWKILRCNLLALFFALHFLPHKFNFESVDLLPKLHQGGEREKKKGML